MNDQLKFGQKLCDAFERGSITTSAKEKVLFESLLKQYDHALITRFTNKVVSSREENIFGLPEDMMDDEVYDYLCNADTLHFDFRNKISSCFYNETKFIWVIEF